MFGQQKINLQEHGNEFEPKAKFPGPGLAELCFITTVPIEQVLGHLRNNEIEVLEGSVQRTGALGSITSVYFRDPDGNLIEVSNYGAHNTAVAKRRITFSSSRRVNRRRRCAVPFRAGAVQKIG